MTATMRHTIFALTSIAVVLGLAPAACSGDTDETTPPTSDGGGLDVTQPDAPRSETSTGSDAAITDAAVPDTATVADVAAFADAAVVLPNGLIDPIPYLSFADSPFKNVSFGYFHLEDWEDSALTTPGVTASSTQLGTAFGTAFVDSVDGDDGALDGTCKKDGGSCNDAFGNGTIEFVFADADAGDAGLSALPTHVGIVWTDGASGCDAEFEAFDASNVSLGKKVAAAVGDGNNNGGTAEDRFFGVVHAAGVKRIVVKSSAGGVEVDHLQYGR
jgi:hypothetical protein